MNRKELIKKYLEFFSSKGHNIIENSSLIPKEDPTVLFTTAGMHPLVPYLLGEKHPQGKRLCSLQKCIRTDDIDEVGDTFHHTFFEMLGNWSLGNYWKKEAIEYSLEFLTKILKIPKEKISVTCFKGDKDAPQDKESANIWKSLGIKKIKFLGKKDNWWGPAGKTGPCGPDTEMFVEEFEIWNDVFMQYNKTQIKAILVDAINTLFDKERKVNQELLNIINSYNLKIIVVTNIIENDQKNKPLVEISKKNNLEIFTLEGNPKKSSSRYFEQLLKKYPLKPEEIIYFDHKKENLDSAKKAGITSITQYENNKKIKDFINSNLYIYTPIKQKNVDTGMGIERTIAILNNLNDDYLTETFKPIIEKIENLSEKKYGKNKQETKAMRIIADHVKAAVFILSEGITPSNTEQGYVLRRLIRRAIRYKKLLGIKGQLTEIANPIFKIYEDYPKLKNNKSILTELEKEDARFSATLENGLNKFNYLIKGKKILSGKNAFLLYQSYGFPIEIIKEEAQKNKIKLNIKEFETEQKKHQELSQTATAGKFKSGLADNSEATKRLHTTTHLLLAALRKVLKDNNIKQKGSNITAQRLRLDFSFPRKLTKEEIKETESLVNQQIQSNLEVFREEMSPEQALKQGALGTFGEKYGKKVSVYSIGNFSKEICAGPHVINTKELPTLKITKEESSSMGIRRIKAILE